MPTSMRTTLCILLVGGLHSQGCGVFVEGLEPGDIVSFARYKGLYYHYAIYIGNWSVIHRSSTSLSSQLSSAVLQAPYFLHDGSEIKDAKSMVQEANLEDVANGCTWEVDNYLDHKHTPLQTEEIVRRAQSKLGEEGYNAFSKNCEHFVTWCRYNVSYSKQSLNVQDMVRKTNGSSLISDYRIEHMIPGFRGSKFDNKWSAVTIPKNVPEALCVTEENFRWEEDDHEYEQHCFWTEVEAISSGSQPPVFEGIYCLEQRIEYTDEPMERRGVWLHTNRTYVFEKIKIWFGDHVVWIHEMKCFESEFTANHFTRGDVSRNQFFTRACVNEEDSTRAWTEITCFCWVDDLPLDTCEF